MSKPNIADPAFWISNPSNRFRPISVGDLDQMSTQQPRNWYAQRRLAIQQANVLSPLKQQQHRAIRDPLHGQLWVLLNAVTKRIVDSEGLPLDSQCPCGSSHQDPTQPCILK